MNGKTHPERGSRWFARLSRLAASSTLLFAIGLLAGALSPSPAGATSVSAVSFVPGLGALYGNTSQSWTVSFTATTGLIGASSGVDVVVTFPTDMAVASPSVALNTSSGFTGTCTSPPTSVTGSAITVGVPSGCSLAAGDTGVVDISSGVTDPPATSSDTAGDFYVSTSADSTPTSAANVPPPVAAGTQVTGVTAVPTSTTANAVTTWTFGFTTSKVGGVSGTAAGELEPGDVVVVGLPGSVTPPSSTDTVTFTGFGASCPTALGAAGGLHLTVGLPAGCSLAAGATGSIAFAAQNPPSTVQLAGDSFDLSTSEDPTAVLGNSTTTLTFSPSGSEVSSAAVAISPDTGNQTASWTVSFTTASSGGGGALYPNDVISLGIPLDVNISSASATAVSGFGSGCSLGLVPITIPTTNVAAVVLESGCTVGAGATATFKVIGVTNPPATSPDASSDFTFSTSEDPTLFSPTVPSPLVGPSGSQVSAVTVSAGSLVQGTTTTWRASFTTSSAGGLVAGDTVTFEFPSALGYQSSDPATFGTTSPSCSESVPTPTLNTYVSPGIEELTVTLPSGTGSCSLANGASGYVQFSFTNPAAQSLPSSDFKVFTSEDPTAVAASSGVTIVLPQANFGLSVADTTSGTSTYTYGDSVALSLSDTTDATAPTGSVSLYFSPNGGFNWSPVPGCSSLTLSGGAATCSTTGLPARTASIDPLEFAYTYTGDTNYAAVTPSGFITVGPTVSLDPATATVGVPNDVIDAGSTYTPSANVTGARNGDTLGVTAVTYTYAGTHGTVYGPSTTAPTAVGSYSVTPSAATLSVTGNGVPADYAPAYVAGSLTILSPPSSGGGSGSGSSGASPQVTLSVALPSTRATVGSSVDLSTEGGSGSGAVTYSVVGGTAPGCAISGTTLTASGPGTCVVEATKAGDATYQADTSAPVTVTFVAAKVVRHHPIAVPRPVSVAFAAGGSSLSPAARRSLIALVRRLHPGATLTVTTWGDPRSLALARARAVDRFLTHYRHLHVRVVAIVSAATRVRVVTVRQ